MLLFASLTLSWLFAGCEPERAGKPPSDSPAADSADSGEAADDSDSAAVIVTGCGDGVVDAREECDDGDANSDSAADACRTDCMAAACGDGVVDSDEACDDGETWGGDGCDPTCAAEVGVGELEPNDDPASASPGDTLSGGRLNGALTEGDVDCWTLSPEACGAVAVTQVGDCDIPLTLSLYDPDGNMLAAGGPADEAGCAAIDPAQADGARYLMPGTWALCARAVNEAEVRGYTLQVDGMDSASLGAAPTGDQDGDGTPDSCDADIDGDGLANEVDNCPEVSNGPDTAPLAVHADGWIQSWLIAGPFTEGRSSTGCRPSDDAFVGEDGAFAPHLLDAAGDTIWTALFMSGSSHDLLEEYSSVSAPREAYALVYLEAAAASTATLSVGADDGVFAWWNGEKVLDESGCQGVNADQFHASVNVAEGVNTLLLKVMDQGGGWGFIARLFAADGTPLTSITPSLSPDAGWIPDQTDTDGDGVGDVCEDGG